MRSVWSPPNIVPPMRPLPMGSANPIQSLEVAKRHADAVPGDIAVYALTGEGVDELREAMRGKVTCLAGQSAVGKSSLLNALFGLELETGGLSRKTERGRHTTRRSEMMAVDGMLKRHLAPQTLERLLRNELCHEENTEDKNLVMLLRQKLLQKKGIYVRKILQDL